MRPEDLQAPFLAGEPGDHPRFDRREVGVDQHVARSSHEGRADQLGERVRHAAEQDPQLVELALLDQIAGEVQRLGVRPRQVLHLHQASGPAAGAVGAVELQQPPHTAVVADGCFDGVVLLGAGLSELLPDLQHPLHLRAVAVTAEQAGDGVLPEVGDLLAGLFLEPGAQLGDAVRVVEPGDLRGLVDQRRAHPVSEIERAADEVHVDAYASDVDAHVGLPFTLHVFRHGDPAEPVGHGHLGHDVLGVVFLEELPLLRVVLRVVPGAAAVGLRRPAGHAEVVDQRLAGAELLRVLRQAEGLADGAQTCRESGIQALDHRAAPLVDREISAEVAPERQPLEHSVVRSFRDLRIDQRFQEPLRQRLALGEIHDLHLGPIEGERAQQDLKVRALYVLVGAGLGDRHAGVGFQVRAEVVHAARLLSHDLAGDRVDPGGLSGYRGRSADAVEVGGS